MTPFVTRGVRFGVRIDADGVAVREWFVTRRYRWDQIAAAGWDDFADGILTAFAIFARGAVEPRHRCLHIALFDDEFVRPLPYVRYRPSSTSDPATADKDRLRAAIGDWVERFRAIAPTDIALRDWWANQLADRATDKLLTPEERMARIRDELDALRQERGTDA